MLRLRNKASTLLRKIFKYLFILLDFTRFEYLTFPIASFLLVLLRKRRSCLFSCSDNVFINNLYCQRINNMIIPTRRQRGVNAVRATTVALFFRCRRHRHLGRGVPTTKWPFPACFPRKIVRDRLLFLRHTVVSFAPEVTTYRVTRSTDLSVCVCVCDAD